MQRGVVSSKLSEIAFQNIYHEQAIMVYYFELAKKWMAMVKNESVICYSFRCSQVI